MTIDRSQAQLLCKHNQIGFCKFGDKCHRAHNNETCPEAGCQEVNWEKRHPMMCKYFASNGRCRFKENCAYAHVKYEKLRSIEKL